MSCWCRGVIAPTRLVVHNPLDAADDAPAWRLIYAGRVANQPAVRATQARLSASTCPLTHPESGELMASSTQS